MEDLLKNILKAIHERLDSIDANIVSYSTDVTISTFREFLEETKEEN